MAIAGFVEELARLAGRADADELVQRSVLPVLTHWESYALSPNGEPLTKEGDEWRPVTNSLHRHIVLARAAVRYPLLAYLRPVRGPNDPDCLDCGGTGNVPMAIEGSGPLKVVCRCGGLGWSPADAEWGPW
jgi:hypothetical protein